VDYFQIMARDHNYFVYIIECSVGLYYTGVTNNITRRLEEHNQGFHPGSFTFKRRPVVLKYSVCLKNVRNAIAWEKQLKGWNRKKKEALFKEDWNEVKRLSNLKQSDKLRLKNGLIG
jgi:putative endonuclease